MSGPIPNSRPTTPPPIPDYELLRCIGTGSYGEVWIARSATGNYRAVKLVYRESFDHERPFEREFSGIQKFEPISRTHDSQVAILHVGRRPDCFYYVMELADDASSGAQIDPSTYQPKTLRTEFLRRGALPTEECVELALNLATALEHLHKHGLVHRDIKPSNIIFVQGIPKLADIGLVASMDATRSFVGTEGFFPPEGPGTPQADIYSLGKVLYEICTGLDRQDFPDLPTRLIENENREPLLELNAIIAKACRADSQQRYQSARELHADLVLLQTGKSVRRVRSLERRLRKLSRIGIAASIAGIIFGIAFLFQRSQTIRARNLADENRHLADKNQQLAEESRRHMLRIQVANGARSLRDGDSVQAALWFAEALKISAGEPAQERLNRFRLEWILREYPRLEQIFLHPEGINSASFSPDGSHVITASKDATARIWDAATGQPITPPMSHEGEVWHASFSPDGKLAITCGRDGTAKLWDAASGTPTASPLKHREGVTSASFNPTGDRVLTSSWDKTAQIWDAKTGQPATPPLQHEGGLNRAVFTPDGTRVVTGSDDRTVRIWDAQTGALLNTLKHVYPADWVSVSADSRRVLSATGKAGGDRQSQAWVWDIESGKLLVETTPRHAGGLSFAEFSPDLRTVVLGSNPLGVHNANTGALMFPALPQGKINSLALSPDGTRVATASEINGEVHVWDLETGKALFAPFKHGSWVYHVEFSRDGLHLLTACDDGSARLWSLVTASSQVATLRHDSPVRSARFSADSKQVLTTTSDGHARLWNSKDGKIAAGNLEGASALEGAVFCRDGRRILGIPSTHSPRPTIRVWDAQTRNAVGTRIEFSTKVAACAISPDGDHVATAEEAGSIQVWSVETGKPVGAPMSHGFKPSLMAFSPDGHQLVAAGDQRTATVWDWRKAQIAFPALEHDAEIRYAAFSPDSQRIATVGYQHAGRVWDAITGKPLSQQFPHQGLMHYANFSPDSLLVATCGLSPRARIWKSATGEQALPPLEHGKSLNHVDFDPTGTILLASSQDKTARLWDLASGEQLIAPLVHGAEVLYGEFAPDGRSFVTAGKDGTARIWGLSSSDFTQDDLLEAAHLLAGQSFSSIGVFVADPPAALQARLSHLRSRYPRYFATAPDQVRNWHEFEAIACEDARRWSAAAWHLSELISETSSNAELLRRRGVLRARLKQWEPARDDFSRALDLGDPTPDLLSYLLFASAKSEAHAMAREFCQRMVERAAASSDGEEKSKAATASALFPGLLDDYSATIKLAQDALQPKPDDPDRRLGLAWQFYRAGRLDDAWKAASQARTNDSARASPSLLALEALICSRRNEPKVAQRYLVLAGQRLRETIEDQTATNTPWTELLFLEIAYAEAQSAIRAASPSTSQVN